MKRNLALRCNSAILLTAFLLSACGAKQTEAAVATTQAASAIPQPTATPPLPPTSTPKPPKVTNIIIDGNFSDWEGYSFVAFDTKGDAPAGTPDFFEIRAFYNDKMFYLAMKLADPATHGQFIVFIDVDGGEHDFHVRLWPHESRNALGGMYPQAQIHVAQGEVVEVKIPLSLIGNIAPKDFTVAVDLGSGFGDQLPDLRPLKKSELEPAPIPSQWPIPGQGPNPGAMRFELTAEDGLPLVGYYYPSWQADAPLILLVHQYGLNQEKWLEYGMVDWLQNWPPSGAAQGLFPAMPVNQSFAVLTVDLRGFGESGPPIPTTLSDEQAISYGQGWITQVKQVLAYAKTLPGVDSSRIAIIAANNGADASVAACGDCLGVLALSPGNYLSIDFKAAAEALDAQGNIVWCFSTAQSAGADGATCASVSGAHYYTENFPGDGRGMQLIRTDKAPEGIAQKILEFLQLVFGFTSN